MDTGSNVIDLAAWLARKRKRRTDRVRCFTMPLQDASPKPPSGEPLEERQRETIEKLRALGYEMCQKPRAV